MVEDSKLALDREGEGNTVELLHGKGGDPRCS
jgi:hypothetical protein